MLFHAVMSVRAAFATLLTLHLLAACALSECAHAAFAPQFVPRGPLADKGGPQWQQAAVRCSSTHSPARRGLRMGGVTAGEGADAEFVLLDSGNFKRLEQFGPLKVQRPCSAAAWNIGSQQLWTDVDLVYKVPDAGKAAAAQKGAWDAKLLKKVALKTLRNWRVSFGDSGVELMLSAGESGQVGVFAEQLDNWRFIKATLLAADSAGWCGGPPVSGPATTEDPSEVTSQDAAAVLRVLNGFAYTGGSTLAAARAVPGRVQVTHLDGSKSSVETARQNAAALDLPVSGVRWMTEDCLTFVQREVKRGSKYEALIFDPPAFGRGGRGKGSKVWKLDTGTSASKRPGKGRLPSAFWWLLSTLQSPAVLCGGYQLALPLRYQ